MIITHIGDLARSKIWKGADYFTLPRLGCKQTTIVQKRELQMSKNGNTIVQKNVNTIVRKRELQLSKNGKTIVRKMEIHLSEKWNYNCPRRKA